jgi:hypothetical protein
MGLGDWSLVGLIVLAALLSVGVYWSISVTTWCTRELKRLRDGGDLGPVPWWVRPFMRGGEEMGRGGEDEWP